MRKRAGSTHLDEGHPGSERHHQGFNWACERTAPINSELQPLLRKRLTSPRRQAPLQLSEAPPGPRAHPAPSRPDSRLVTRQRLCRQNWTEPLSPSQLCRPKSIIHPLTSAPKWCSSVAQSCHAAQGGLRKSNTSLLPGTGALNIHRRGEAPRLSGRPG